MEVEQGGPFWTTAAADELELLFTGRLSDSEGEFEEARQGKRSGCATNIDREREDHVA